MRNVLRRIWRAVFANSDLALCVLLIGIVLWLANGVRNEPPDEAVVLATLAGAMFGRAAILLVGLYAAASKERQRANDRKEIRA